MVLCKQLNFQLSDTIISLGNTALFEPTSVTKSLKVLKDKNLLESSLSSPTLRYISPNNYELKAMYTMGEESGLFDVYSEWFCRIDMFNLGSKFRQGLPIICFTFVPHFFENS